VLDATDGAHLIQYLMGGAERVFQVGGLSDVPDVRTDDKGREEYEEPPRHALFRPVPLLVKAHTSSRSSLRSILPTSPSSAAEPVRKEPRSF
jgi:hypothetical protein